LSQISFEVRNPAIYGDASPLLRPLRAVSGRHIEGMLALDGVPDQATSAFDESDLSARQLSNRQAVHRPLCRSKQAISSLIHGPIDTVPQASR
jgi:hypothetical protein